MIGGLNSQDANDGRVVLIVEAGLMYGNGLEFFQSAHGVWLTDLVPVTHVRSPSEWSHGGN
jgi:RNA:NAD 2'-phosphotransferase (TPT1/KptA family)